MNRSIFNTLLLRILLNNGIEPTKAVAIAAVAETTIFDMPGGESLPDHPWCGDHPDEPKPPLPGSLFWKSAALVSRSKHWPKRFKAIPMQITMLETVCADFARILDPLGEMILGEGLTYIATCNSHGAVCGICDSGKELGVKPDEFEVTAWYPFSDAAYPPMTVDAQRSHEEAIRE